MAKESLRPYGGSQKVGDHTSAPPFPHHLQKQPSSIYRLPGRSGIAQRNLFLKKELLELLVSLAADLFDFEVAPWSTSLFGRLGDNCRYRFTSRDWFFCRIAFDIHAIESIEIRLWMQRRISVFVRTHFDRDAPVVKNRRLAPTLRPSFIQLPSRRRGSPVVVETALSAGAS